MRNVETNASAANRTLTLPGEHKHFNETCTKSASQQFLLETSFGGQGASSDAISSKTSGTPKTNNHREHIRTCMADPEHASHASDKTNEHIMEDLSRVQIERRIHLVRQQRKIALTLFLVTSVFVLCHLPTAILDLKAWGVPFKFRLDSKWKELIFGSFWFSVPANPVIYAFMSTKFREESRFLWARLRLNFSRSNNL